MRYKWLKLFTIIYWFFTLRKKISSFETGRTHFFEKVPKDIIQNRWYTLEEKLVCFLAYTKDQNYLYKLFFFKLWTQIFTMSWVNLSWGCEKKGKLTFQPTTFIKKFPHPQFKSTHHFLNFMSSKLLQKASYTILFRYYLNNLEIYRKRTRDMLFLYSATDFEHFFFRPRYFTKK